MLVLAARTLRFSRYAFNTREASKNEIWNELQAQRGDLRRVDIHFVYRFLLPSKRQLLKCTDKINKI